MNRINVNIPQALFNRSQELIQKGYFQNFSELVRDGIRGKIREYETEMTEDERKLFALLKEAESKKLLLNEEEMKKHGLHI